MSLLASCTERRPEAFYFALSNAATGTVLEAPVQIQNDDNSHAAVINCGPAGSVFLSGSATGAINPAAALVLGPESSQAAVTITNNAGSDFMQVGRATVTGLTLGSAATLGGAMSIKGDTVVGTEVINIGPNANAPACLQIGPANSHVVATSPYTTQVVIPQLANGTGTIPGNSGVVLTNPGTAGLYWVAASCSSVDGPSVASQIGCLCYYNGATWKAGGIAIANVGTGGVSLSPAPGTAATINFFNDSGGNLVNMSFVRMPLFNGLITGMP